MYKIILKNSGVPRGYIFKMLLIMKLTTIILITSLLQVTAASFGQRLNLTQKNVTIEKILIEVKFQTGYDVLVFTSKFKTDSKINADFKNASLEQVMDKIVSSDRFTYSIEDKNVVIKEKEPSFLDRIAAITAAIDIHGRVLDPEGRPLSGATLTVVGSKNSSITSQSGEFHLHNVSENAKIRISYIGYFTRELKATDDLSKITLEINDSKLDEVQVIAYGTTTKRLSTGNVTTVSAKDFENQPVSNVLSVLSGRVPGMNITQISGMPGGGYNLDIRGRNSISSGSDPLYIIDGVPVPSQSVNVLENSTNNPNASGYILNYINPSDIQSIEVLKDADATSIYGSRGANGVVLITTKKGKPGKTTFSLNAQTGISQMNQVKKYLNTEQYLEMRREAFKNDGITPTLAAAPDLLAWDQTRYTDWQKVLLGRKAHFTDIQASLSGGGSNFQYLLSSGFQKRTTVVPGDFNDQKGSFHFSSSYDSEDHKFKATLTGNLMVDDNRLPEFDPTSSIMTTAPNAPEPLNPDGSINWENGTWSTNPFSYLLRKSRTKVNNWVLNTNLSYELFTGMQIQTTVGYTNLYTDEYNSFPIAAQMPRINRTRVGSAWFGNNNNSTLILEPQANYRVSLGKGTLSVLAGANITRSLAKGHGIYATGYTSDALLENMLGAVSTTINSVNDTKYRYAAVFGRLNYNYEDKYILNINGRRDGSSRFGPGNRFANFGSAAVAWIFTQEKFIKSALPFLSFGKLRTSYGTSGNDQILDYNYLPTYVPPFFGNYGGTIGLYPEKLYNPNYQWEVNKKAEVGLDLGFLQDRLVWNISYYRNRSSNQLLDTPLPITTGFSSIFVNQAAVVQNMGFESVLNTTNIKNKNLSWSTSINITIPDSKLISYPGLETLPENDRFVIGQPITIKKVYKMINLDPATGKFVYLGKDGQPTTQPVEYVDNVGVINLGKQFYGGLENNIRYKNFSLSFLLRFVKQKGYSNLYNYQPGSFRNQPLIVLDRWQKPGDITNIPPFSQNPNANYFAVTNAFNSDLFYTNTSFIRLSNLSLSYELPEAVTKKLHLKNFKFYASANNLFTITRFKGTDPENSMFNTSSVYNLPPLRMITGGIRFEL